MAELFIENLAQVKEAFEKIVEAKKEEFRTECGEAVEQVCQSIEDTAKELVPVRSGELKNSIRHKVSGLYGRVFTDDVLHYAHMVHFGSIHNTADPFLYKASERHQDELQEVIQKIADGQHDK